MSLMARWYLTDGTTVETPIVESPAPTFTFTPPAPAVSVEIFTAEDT